VIGTLLLSVLACGSPGNAEAEPAAEALAAAVYSNGMWAARVLTVTAGLDEALGTLAKGDTRAAADLCAAVYRGSFEPELEPLIRAHLGRQISARTEYGFGLVRQALLTGDSAKAQTERDALVAMLIHHAESLDKAGAVLTD
jgi:hypothetical protein